jgi:hypothetical protein
MFGIFFRIGAGIHHPKPKSEDEKERDSRKRATKTQQEFIHPYPW